MTAQGAVPHDAIGLAVSALVSLAAPVVVFLVCQRMALPPRNIAIGLAVFLVFALLLEGTLNRFVLVWNPASAAWFRAHGLAFAAYGALAAAVFEETGRLLAMRYVVKPAGDPGSFVSYGLGHGGIEAVIIGAMAQAQMIVFVLLQRAGKLDATLGAKIPAAALAKLHGQIAHLDLAAALASGVERVCALLLQLALSALVWRAVSRRQWRWFAAALALHAGIDSAAALHQRGMLPLEAVEGIVFAVGAGLAVLFLRNLPRKMAAA